MELNDAVKNPVLMSFEISAGVLFGLSISFLLLPYFLQFPIHSIERESQAVLLLEGIVLLLFSRRLT